MNEHDRMSVVTYSSAAEEVFPLTSMSEGLRPGRITELEALDVQTSTNLWAGLHTSMESLRNPPNKVEGEEDRLKVILLLTDGQPNEVPDRGHITELRDYKD